MSRQTDGVQSMWTILETPTKYNSYHSARQFKLIKDKSQSLEDMIIAKLKDHKELAMLSMSMWPDAQYKSKIIIKSHCHMLKGFGTITLLYIIIESMDYRILLINKMYSLLLLIRGGLSFLVEIDGPDKIIVEFFISSYFI